MEKIRLYHTGFEEIRRPDVHRGRINADFGQGFYLSPDEEFSRRWARTRKGEATIINSYELTLDGLKVMRLERNAEWFDIIYRNRSLAAGAPEGFDVVIGPIANDTIYDTWGITTSGLLTREQSLELLMIGNVYLQAVVRTEQAAERLRWLSARELTEAEVAGYRQTVAREQEEFQLKFMETFNRLTG